MATSLVSRQGKQPPLYSRPRRLQTKRRALPPRYFQVASKPFGASIRARILVSFPYWQQAT
ncbi:hypothetical protein [Eikenella corrodens]|uniref:hypothetical protein n=1 Tax=Eikenella corrodens TaxID=539 RepID=UPI00142F8414|nr:hypothetical protein [Eikenella corrodens]